MQARFLLIWFISLTALCPVVLASGKSDKKAAITLHMETESTDNPKMIFNHDFEGQNRFFRRMPEISGRDIASFKPFVSDSGADSGAVFKLKPNGARRLSTVTSANQGRWFVTMVNGRILDGVVIDKQINDGIVVIWKGLTAADIATLDETLPRIGEEGPKDKRSVE